MHLRLSDSAIESDQVFGPIPCFEEPFESFFIKKAFNLLLNEQKILNNKEESESEFRYISLLNDTNLELMYHIELSKNSREQNMEIIYNNNQVYFKTIKTIYKDEILNAFPSKDLEISLGIQFIPFNSDQKYNCKKCTKNFEYQYNLMLHSRYFCSLNTNNFLKNFSNLKRKQSEYELMNPKKRQKEDVANNVTNQINFNHQQFNWAQLYNSFQTIIQNISKNKVSYEQYFNHIPNQALKDYLITQIYAYLENQKILNEKKIMNQISPNSSNSSPLLSPNLSLNNNHNKIIAQNTVANNLTLNVPHSPTIKPNMIETKLLINNQTLQNWCAKCNSHFRLTSDLVYHMRTYHRKDELKISNPIVEFGTNFYDQSSYGLNREIKYLKCEICNETFKEKHHLTRHLTSHR